MDQSSDDNMAMLHVMLQQERYYQAHPYEQLPQAQHESSCPVNGDCRSAMAAWCDQCVDFCKFSRESVEITLNYMDRFVATPAGKHILQDRSRFQLATMTALYSAIKIHQAEALASETVASLSRGRYSKSEIEDMERTLLTALQWRMHPVTTDSFVREFVSLLPVGLLKEANASSVAELAKLQTQLAVRSADLIGFRRSVVACGAFLNALDSIDVVNSTTLEEIRLCLSAVIHVDVQEIRSMQRRLYSSVLGLDADDTTTKSSSDQNKDSTNRRRPLVQNTNNNGDQQLKQRRIEGMNSPRAAVGI